MSDYLLSDVMISLRYQYASRGQEVPPAATENVLPTLISASGVVRLDLQSIYAYLKTVPPVRNRVPEPLPPPVD
jgi:hypothetical protein